MPRIGNKWKVEAGESMSMIAKGAGVPFGKMKKWNKNVAPDPDKIYVGQMLWLMDPLALRKWNMDMLRNADVLRDTDTSQEPRAMVPNKRVKKEGQQKPAVKMPHSERFVVCVERVLGHEGGKADDEDDAGGKTNYGISQFIFPRMQKDGLTKATDVWDITRDEATEAYHTYFWLPMRCDRRPPGVDYFLFDSAIQHGEGVARKFAKRCMDNLEFLRTEREGFYMGIVKNSQTQEKFLKGWLRRLNEVYEVACEDEEKA